MVEDLQTTKVIQKAVLNILDRVIEVCEEHNLRYYVMGGALIGTMRSNGFIPWDDDIDIVLPRKDFDRLHTLLREYPDPSYGVCDYETNSDWHFAIFRFVDYETELETHYTKSVVKTNAWIDIFPIDGMPSDKRERERHMKRVMKCRYKIQMKYINTQTDAIRRRAFKERFAIGLLKVIPIGKLFRTEKLMKNLEACIQKYDYETSEYVADLLGRYRIKEVFPKEYYGEAIYGTFEGRKICMPHNTHEVLTQIYGDYMTPPPAPERTGHETSIVCLRKGIDE